MSERDELAKAIWEVSRADEGSISATGANIVADALLAAGYGHVPTALRCAATMIEGRSNQFFDTMQRMVGAEDTGPDDILRYGSYGLEAQSLASIIRRRADETEGVKASAS